MKYVYRSKTNENPSFIMLKSVCHKIVFVKGGLANADKSGGGASQKVTNKG